MTKKNEDALVKLSRLADFLADDVINASDEEILAEFVEDCGSQEAAIIEMEKLQSRMAEILAKAKAGTK